MKKFGGILIMPSSPNGDTVRNVLAVLFDEKCLERENLPKVNKITFLESADMTSMRIDGTGYELECGYSKILKNLSLEQIEIRRKRIFSNVKDIPTVIMAAVREVGTENIILDLTSGKKDITGSLYTAATMSGIENMTYIDVKSKSYEDGGGFYNLSLYSDKNDKYSVKKFEAIDELEDLASLNSMEFIEYRKTIDEIRKKLMNSPKAEYYVTTLESAVDNYFSHENLSVRSCIQKVGLINEDLVACVASAIAEKYPVPDISYNSKSPYAYLCSYQKKYNKLLLRRKDGTITSDENEILSNIENVYSHIVPLHPLMETIKLYRNTVSHNISAQFTKEDAKLAVDIIIRLIYGIKDSSISDAVFGNMNMEFEEI